MFCFRPCCSACLLYPFTVTENWEYKGDSYFAWHYCAMNRAYLGLLCVCMFFTKLSEVGAVVGGNNGYIRTPAVGEYCTNFFQEATFSRLFYTTNYLNDCAACFSGASPACPWLCYNGCAGEQDRESPPEVYSYTYICSAGCVATASCTAKPNSYFTGSGTITGDATSCPFACNAGYTKSGSSCVAVAPLALAPGEYCTDFFAGLSTVRYWPYSSSEWLCASCVTGSSKLCPWSCNNGCYGTEYGYDQEYDAIYYAVSCDSGCVTKASCTAKPNSYFTGSGTITGDATSCPFGCNAGYTKSGSSCVSACTSTQYWLNGVCTACATCSQGYYLSGCGVTSPGVCTSCTN